MLVVLKERLDIGERKERVDVRLDVLPNHHVQRAVSSRFSKVVIPEREPLFTEARNVSADNDRIIDRFMHLIVLSPRRWIEPVIVCCPVGSGHLNIEAFQYAIERGDIERLERDFTEVNMDIGVECLVNAFLKPLVGILALSDAPATFLTAIAARSRRWGRSKWFP